MCLSVCTCWFCLFVCRVCVVVRARVRLLFVYLFVCPRCIFFGDAGCLVAMMLGCECNRLLVRPLVCVRACVVDCVCVCSRLFA